MGRGARDMGRGARDMGRGARDMGRGARDMGMGEGCNLKSLLQRKSSFFFKST